jgi:hypothetical protein
VTLAPTQLGQMELENSTSSTKSEGLYDSSQLQQNVVRVNKVCAGGAFGEADFFLGKRHR